MRIFIVSILIILSSPVLSQAELINSFVQQSSVYGGMEDGGISTITQYTFIANAPITMVNIKSDSGNLKLKKGDSLIINLSSYQPYQDSETLVETPNESSLIFDTQFSLTIYAGTGYVNIDLQLQLPFVLTYQFNDVEHIAICKSEIDQRNVAYAP